MPDDPLIHELRELAALVAVPPAPDVRAAVRARLAARPRRRWRAVAAALAVAVLIAVVPPARAAVAHAVSDLLDFAGVRVRQGQPALPPSPAPLPSARAVGLDEARRLAGFPIGVPARLGPPEQVRVADGARVVTLLYRGGAVRLDRAPRDGPARRPDAHLDRRSRHVPSRRRHVTCGGAHPRGLGALRDA